MRAMFTSVRWAAATALASTLLLGMSVTKTTTKAVYAGKPIEMVTLKNSHGMEVQAISYGAIITSIKVPDRGGKIADVVLGFDSPDQYWHEPTPPFFGAVVGRYGNRIAKGKFTLDGKTYSLAINNPPVAKSAPLNAIARGSPYGLLVIWHNIQSPRSASARVA